MLTLLFPLVTELLAPLYFYWSTQCKASARRYQ